MRQVGDHLDHFGSLVTGHQRVGQDIAWARWLPGGKMLLAGGSTFSGVVNSGTLAVRPYYFVPGRDHYIEDSQDVNYSAVVIKR